MTKTEIEEHFAGAKSSPYATAPQGEVLSWNPQVSPEAALERKALAFGLDSRPPTVQTPPDMYQQAVALDGKEPAATPFMPPTVGIPAATPFMPPTVGIPASSPTSGVIAPFDPAFVDLTVPTTGPTSRPVVQGVPAPQGNILRDSSGAPVMSGSGGVIGLPNQGPGAQAGATGGKGGSPTAPTGGGSPAPSGGK